MSEKTTLQTFVDELFDAIDGCACNREEPDLTDIDAFKAGAEDILYKFAEWWMEGCCDECDQKMADEPTYNEGYM